MVKLGQEVKSGAGPRDEFSAKVARKAVLGGDYRSLALEVPLSQAGVLAKAKPGQFIEIACGSSRVPGQAGLPFLRRPFSISSLAQEKNEAGELVVRLEVIHNVIGPGTQWMAQVDTEVTVSLIGPLGNGFALPEKGPDKSLLVGGGVGVPPMFFLADWLNMNPENHAIGFAGLRTKSQFEHSICSANAVADQPLMPLALLEPFNRSKTNSVIATDDGSFGFEGNVVAALDRFLDEHPDWESAQIYGCGPEVMLKALAMMAKRRDMACQVCLEAYMACGFGVCQSCVVSAWIDPDSDDRSEANRHYVRVCDEGPVFDANKIVWE